MSWFLLAVEEADTELTRDYEVDISEWYLPLMVVTREVDYPDVAVQVRRGTPKTKNKHRMLMVQSRELTGGM